MQEEHTITIPLLKKDEADLTPEEARLLKQAKEATYRSYSPYSRFSVGAAALLEDGTIVEGSNQENAAYPSGLCAERTAVFYAKSRYPDKAVVLLCVVARDTSGQFTDRPIPPCGACCQVLMETESRQTIPLRVMLYGRQGTYFIDTVKNLLPIHFDASYL
jgi:cytidine deaminase